MRRFDIALPAEQVTRMCRDNGLEVKPMPRGGGPGARHWHMKRPGAPGILELTELDGRVWFQVKEHWDGGWATDMAEALSGNRRLD
jgi:hypothetical protein